MRGSVRVYEDIGLIWEASIIRGSMWEASIIGNGVVKHIIHNIMKDMRNSELP